MTRVPRVRPAVLLSTLSLVVAGLAGSVVAAPPAGAETRSTTFTTSGSYTVPPGITTVHVRAVGGYGGRAFDNTAGGRGAVVEADLAVVPGQELRVHVGGPGDNGRYSDGGSGGANGGGAGGSWMSGGGGGGSDVRIGGDTLADRVLVAAGGGGATFATGGSLGGGSAGQAGGQLAECGGNSPAQPGTESAGGAGSSGSGSCAYWAPGGAGSFGTGGAGGFDGGSNNSGGGGGAGWYGGGGGGSFAAGAGGSSHVSSTIGSGVTTTLAAYGTPPEVVISYDRVAQDVAFGAGTPTEVVAGTTYDLDATGGSSGNPVSLALGAGTTTDACTLSGDVLAFAHAGTCEVVATQAGDDSFLPGTATLTIEVAPAPTTTTLSVAAGELAAGVSVDPPSTLSPAGDVRFLLGGEVVGTATIDDGVATLAGTAPDVLAAGVTAEYLGTTDLAPSSGGATRAAQEVSFAAASPRAAVVGTAQALTAVPGVSGAGVTLAVGPGTTADACTVTGSTVTFAHAGTCSVVVHQAGDWRYRPATATHVVEVTKAATTTAVSVQAASIRARVDAIAPSVLTPSGTVRFLVDGTVVGSSDLVAGVATLTRAMPSGATRTVTAEYLGSADTVSSSASTTRSDPTIIATVSSARPATAGWYRTPVTVSFTCQERGAALTGCPAAVVLSGSGADQTATGTVTAVDGGSASVTVAGIGIDTTAPVVKVTGVKNGKKYAGTRKPNPRCVATDKVSGLARACSVNQTVVKRTRAGIVMRYRAVARDVAGNVTTVVGRYTLATRRPAKG